jgi:hypothetical protein
MPVYHQMGHDSENLLHSEGLGMYRGAILSPVNYRQDKIIGQIARARTEPGFETIFDPQLYVPTSDRGSLREWSYFPADVDTADISSDAWWDKLVDMTIADVTAISPSAVCSPAIVPRAFVDDYFSTMVRAGNRMATQLSGTSIGFLQTAVVGLGELALPERALAIASILSQSQAERIFLVFVGTTDPRRELADVEELKGAMRLISFLREANVHVLVGFCSSDMLLWKVAGATDCATGKFFNLRRFTRSRFEEPTKGGGQLAYWFEETLVSFLREADVVRVAQRSLLSSSSLGNPFAGPIFERLQKGEAWLALSWRQFMHWFGDAEDRISAGALDVPKLLEAAEQHWLDLEDKGVLMEEPRNNGAWLRPWRRAIVEFGT